jgi:hypothetical protein
MVWSSFLHAKHSARRGATDTDHLWLRLWVWSVFRIVPAVGNPYLVRIGPYWRFPCGKGFQGETCFGPYWSASSVDTDQTLIIKAIQTTLFWSVFCDRRHKIRALSSAWSENR